MELKANLEHLVNTRYYHFVLAVNRHADIESRGLNSGAVGLAVNRHVDIESRGLNSGAVVLAVNRHVDIES